MEQTPEDQEENISSESHCPPKPCKAHRAWWCLVLLFTLNKDTLLTECVLHTSGVATPTSMVSVTAHTHSNRPHRKPVCPHPDHPGTYYLALWVLALASGLTSWVEGVGFCLFVCSVPPPPLLNTLMPESNQSSQGVCQVAERTWSLQLSHVVLPRLAVGGARLH